MPGRNEAIYKRALMRDLMRRVQRIGAQCGGNGQEMLPDNGGGGDEFSNVAHRVTVAMEGIKRDARAKCRVAHAQSQHEAIALVHEIRKKKVGLKEDLKRLQALNAELETQISKKREKSNGKQKKEVWRSKGGLYMCTFLCVQTDVIVYAEPTGAPVTSKPDLPPPPPPPQPVPRLFATDTISGFVSFLSKKVYASGGLSVVDGWMDGR